MISCVRFVGFNSTTFINVMILAKYLLLSFNSVRINTNVWCYDNNIIFEIASILYTIYVLKT
jgi:hypothetical protein